MSHVATINPGSGSPLGRPAIADMPRLSHYVLGFAFDYDMENVALIRKNRPKWQAGKLNGIGGKVELGESPGDAMIREFQEETGAAFMQWKHFAQMTGGSTHDAQAVTNDNLPWIVDLYACRDYGLLRGIKTKTDEQVLVVPVACIQDNRCVENLNWTIQAAIDHLTDGRPKFITAVYP